MALSEDDVMQALRDCYDPEIPVNIVDLGLIYKVVLTPDANSKRAFPRQRVEHTRRSGNGAGNGYGSRSWTIDIHAVAHGELAAHGDG